MRVRGKPRAGEDRNRRHRDTGRRLELHALRGVRRVDRRIREVRLFGRHEVAEIRLHRRDVRLRLGVGELRDRDRGQDADDHDNDQKLDQGEAATGRAHRGTLECKWTPRGGRWLGGRYFGGGTSSPPPISSDGASSIRPAWDRRASPYRVTASGVGGEAAATGEFANQLVPTMQLVANSATNVRISRQPG